MYGLRDNARTLTIVAAAPAWSLVIHGSEVDAAAIVLASTSQIRGSFQNSIRWGFAKTGQKNGKEKVLATSPLNGDP